MTTSPVKTSAALEKKDVQKLQRAIIDGLEDVKAQDIVVFDTEHITSLFERVIIASGTSNRQTKALAASVRDAVRDAGFSKPRIEGEDNGEWIIVDCGSAVAHIMQPTIRAYYHLEELWGDKPIKLKLGAPAPLVKAAKVDVKAEPEAKVKPGRKVAAKKSAKPAVKAPVRIPTTTVDSSYVGRIGKTNDWTAKRNATETAAEPVAKSVTKARKPAAKTPIVKVQVAKKVAAKKVAAKTAAKTAAKKPAPRSK
ncbi:MAG: ribosome silencing factor [Polaromonas sp.]